MATLGFVPQDLLQLNCFMKDHKNKNINLNLLLPTVITKFMNFKSVREAEFRSKWKKNNQNIWKSEDFIANEEIISAPQDFKRYFNNLVDLKTANEFDVAQGKKPIKLGGIFEMQLGGSEFYIKFVFLPNHQIRFQVSGDQVNKHIIQFMIQSLVFLFKQS
jgi:hypothetical protein